MPNYISRALNHFQHTQPTRRQDSPHQHDIPKYGAKVQYAKQPDNTAALNAKGKKKVHEVLRTLLYYARAIDSTMLPTIGTLAT